MNIFYHVFDDSYDMSLFYILIFFTAQFDILYFIFFTHSSTKFSLKCSYFIFLCVNSWYVYVFTSFSKSNVLLKYKNKIKLIR